jgi:hypothetical protein
MSSQLRSKQGCWTCRLRKKKCDEKRPTCSICESLSITCYGYGPRPDWMNNGEKEKAIMKSLKETVRLTSRRKGATLSSQHNTTVLIAPKATDHFADIPNSVSGLNHQHSSLSPSDQDLLTPDGGDSLQDELTVSIFFLGAIRKV